MISLKNTLASSFSTTFILQTAIRSSFLLLWIFAIILLCIFSVLHFIPLINSSERYFPIFGWDTVIFEKGKIILSSSECNSMVVPGGKICVSILNFNDFATFLSI